MASVLLELVHTESASSRSAKYTRRATLVILTILVVLLIHECLSSNRDVTKLLWNHGETETFVSGGTLSLSFAGMSSVMGRFEINNTVIVTVANPAYSLFLENWDCYAKPLIGRGFLVFTNNYDFGRRISERDGYHVLVQSSRSWWQHRKKALDYGTVEYQRLMLMRTRLVAHLLEVGRSVLIVDNDAVWLSNPLPYLEGNNAHMVTTKDGTVEADESICGGFLYLKNSPTTKRVWSEVTRQHRYLVAQWRASRTLKSEQEVLDHIFTEERSMLGHSDSEFEPLQVHFLDPLLFPNGIFYFTERHPQAKNVTPVVIHNNWILGFEGKLKRFQEFGLWRVAPTNTARPVDPEGGHRCIT